VIWPVVCVVSLMEKPICAIAPHTLFANPVHCSPFFGVFTKKEKVLRCMSGQ
jgi:hypothetical protein